MTKDESWISEESVLLLYLYGGLIAISIYMFGLRHYTLSFAKTICNCDTVTDTDKINEHLGNIMVIHLTVLLGLWLLIMDLWSNTFFQKKEQK